MLQTSINPAEHSTVCVIPCAHLYFCYLWNHTWIPLSILPFLWFLVHICISVIYETIHQSHWAFYRLCDSLCTFAFLLFMKPYMNHVEHSTVCVIPCAHLHFCYLWNHTSITLSILPFVWFLVHICIPVIYETIHQSHWAFYRLCDSLCTFAFLLFMKPYINHIEHSTVCVIPCAHLHFCYLWNHTWITLSILPFVWFLVHICISVIYETIHQSHWAFYHLCDSLCTFVLTLFIRSYMNHVEHSTVCVIPCAHLY